jgi:hypothetical protein
MLQKITLLAYLTVGGSNGSKVALATSAASLIRAASAGYARNDSQTQLFLFRCAFCPDTAVPLYVCARSRHGCAFTGSVPVRSKSSPCSHVRLLHVLRWCKLGGQRMVVRGEEQAAATLGDHVGQYSMGDRVAVKGACPSAQLIEYDQRLGCCITKNGGTLVALYHEG